MEAVRAANGDSRRKQAREEGDLRAVRGPARLSPRAPARCRRPRRSGRPRVRRPPRGPRAFPRSRTSGGLVQDRGVTQPCPERLVASGGALALTRTCGRPRSSAYASRLSSQLDDPPRTHLGLRVDDHVPDAQRDVLGGEGAKVVLARPHNRPPALQVQLAEAVPVLHELLEAKPKAAEVLSPLGVLLTLVERQQVCKQLAGAASGPRCK